MKFEWDENKRRSNLQKHGIDLAKACRLFDSLTVDYQDLRYDYGEDRFIAIGEVEGQILNCYLHLSGRDYQIDRCEKGY